MSCLQHGEYYQPIACCTSSAQPPGEAPGTRPARVTTQLSRAGCFGSWAMANGKNKTKLHMLVIRQCRCYLPEPLTPCPNCCACIAWGRGAVSGAAEVRHLPGRAQLPGQRACTADEREEGPAQHSEQTWVPTLCLPAVNTVDTGSCWQG